MTSEHEQQMVVSGGLTLADLREEALREIMSQDCGSGISWNDVEEYGEPVGGMRAGDAFVCVLADKDLMTLKTFTGVVTRIGWGSVSVQIERAWDNDTITWAPDAKVIPLPKNKQV